jgi:beta-glucosidase
MPRHQSFLKRGKEGPIDVLFLGDSITERWETSGSKVWAKHYGNMKAAEFGVGGDRTQHVLWRIEHGELDGISPKVLVLMLGTNNSNSDPAEEIVAGDKKIIQEIREKLPKTKILLLGIFPRAAKRDLPENVPMQRVTAANKELAKMDDGKTLRYLDISDKLMRDGKVPEDLLPDGVHPNEKGYEIWAEAMDPLLKEMLAE